jgi:hypothetical protein
VPPPDDTAGKQGIWARQRNRRGRFGRHHRARGRNNLQSTLSTPQRPTCHSTNHTRTQGHFGGDNPAYSSFSIVDEVISVACEDSSLTCIIDGETSRRAFYVKTYTSEGPAASFTGISFIRGQSPDGVSDGGGGLRVFQSVLDINSCVFSDNVARYETSNAFTGAGVAGKGTQTTHPFALLPPS